MKLRILTAALLSSVVISGPVLAQSQPLQDKAAESKPVKQKKDKTAKQAAQSAKTAQQTPSMRDGRAMGGLTASPTDFGNVFAGSAANKSAGGVSGKDIGGGYMIEEETPKSRSTVTRDAIDKLQPTANPYQMIQLLPGANVSSTDANGLNGGNITMRGLNSDQIGLTIEGAPVNDSGNYAIYPQEYVDAENIEQISIAQGSPDLDSPHIGSTGGVINVYMRDPSKTAGGYVSTSVGTHNAKRIFVRAESGQIGNVRGYLSYSHYEANHWTGPGKDLRDHVDGKIVIDTEGGNHIRASVIYNNALNNFYPNPSIAQYAGSTAGWANILYHPIQSSSTDTSWYKYKINPFRNLIASAPSDFKITDKLTYDLVPYMWYGFGSGGGATTLTESTTGSTSPKFFYGNSQLYNIDWNGNGTVTNGQKQVFFNPSITETYRPGIVNKLTYAIDNHKIVGGYWFEYASHKQTGPFQAVQSDGSVVNPFMTNSDGFVIPSGPYAGNTLMKRDLMTHTMTNTFFIGDTWSLMNEKLKIEYGIKEAIVSRNVDNYLPGAATPVKSNDTATLPTVGLSYKITDTHTLFTSLGTSFRVTPNYALATAFSNSTGAVSTLATNSLKPEQGVTVEAGHRYQGDVFATSATLFGTQFRNRQVTSNIVDPLTGANESYNLNAGSVSIYGIDGEIGLRPIWGGLRPYISGELLHTELNNNLPIAVGTSSDYLPTKGKELPRAPNYTSAIGLDWDDGHIIANLNYKYLGPQYSTFMNDEKMKAYGVLNAAIGYRFADTQIMNGFSLKTPEIKLSLTNILDKRTLTGVSSVQTNAIATKGVNGNTISASSPSYYAGEGFAAMLTFKTGF